MPMMLAAFGLPFLQPVTALIGKPYKVSVLTQEVSMDSDTSVRQPIYYFATM